MKLSKEHIGKRAVLINDYDSLKQGSEVIIRGVKSLYIVEPIKGKSKWIADLDDKYTGHTCSGFFKERIGYNVDASRLELIEEITEETIEDNFEIPPSLIKR